MKLSEIRSMHVSELEKRLAETKIELAKERAVVAGGTRPEKPGKIRTLRRSIARMLTIINEKERAAGKASAKEAEHAVVKPTVAGKPVAGEAAGKDAKASARAVVKKEGKVALHKEKKAVAEGSFSSRFFAEAKKAAAEQSEAVFPQAFLPKAKKAVDVKKVVEKKKLRLKKQAKKGKR